METFLPMWIIGAPAVALVVDWMLTDKKRASDGMSYSRAPSATAVR
jgi:hypothetical protein